MALYFCKVIRLEGKGRAGAVCWQSLKGKALPRRIQQKSSAGESTRKFSGRFGCFGSSRATAQNLYLKLEVFLVSGLLLQMGASPDFFSLGETHKSSPYFFIVRHLHGPRGLGPPHSQGSFFFFSPFDAFNIVMIKLGRTLFSGEKETLLQEILVNMPFRHPKH